MKLLLNVDMNLKVEILYFSKTLKNPQGQKPSSDLDCLYKDLLQNGDSKVFIEINFKLQVVL